MIKIKQFSRFRFRDFVTERRLALSALFLLVATHLVQLLFFASIVAGDDAQRSAQFILSNLSTSTTVAFIHAPQVALFVPVDRKYSFVVVNEKLTIGDSPLEFPQAKRANFIVMARGLSEFSSFFSEEKLKVLRDDYVLQSVGRFDIYTEQAMFKKELYGGSI